jgi:hypothetical protein
MDDPIDISSDEIIEIDSEPDHDSKPKSAKPKVVPIPSHLMDGLDVLLKFAKSPARDKTSIINYRKVFAELEVISSRTKTPLEINSGLENMETKEDSVMEIPCSVVNHDPKLDLDDEPLSLPQINESPIKKTKLNLHAIIPKPLHSSQEFIANHPNLASQSLSSERPNITREPTKHKPRSKRHTASEMTVLICEKIVAEFAQLPALLEQSGARVSQFASVTNSIQWKRTISQEYIESASEWREISEPYEITEEWTLVCIKAHEIAKALLENPQYFSQYIERLDKVIIFILDLTEFYKKKEKYLSKIENAQFRKEFDGVTLKVRNNNLFDQSASKSDLETAIMLAQIEHGAKIQLRNGTKSDFEQLVKSFTVRLSMKPQNEFFQLI